MKIYYDKYHQPERPTVYLGTPNHKVVCALNGIDDDSFSLKANLNNTYELSFDVPKFISIDGVEIESNAYSLIDMLMRVYVTGIGWFLLEAPKINNDGKKEIKSITAQSAEIEMQQHDIRNLKIGQGTTDSYEMLIKENVHIDDDGVERAIEKIKFYNPDNPKLSLLDILMKVSGLKDWTVGYIDPAPKIYKYYEEGELKDKQVSLSDEEGAFDIGTQDLYSFLTQDAAQLYSCVFVFDFNKLTINAYRPENLGKDTNINIGFRNLQQSNDISVDEKNIFTRYQVSGSDDLGIQYVNFGSNIIENLDYYLTEKYLSPDVIAKYKLWQDDVEIQRPLYIEQTRLYNEQMNIISELKNRVPLDDCSTDWSTFSDEKLLEAQANYQAQLKGYEDFYVDENGNFDKTALDASSDARDYYQIQDVILPSIQIEIDNRNLPTKEGEADYIDSYKTDWKLYGLDELEAKLTVYNKRKKILEDYEYGGEYKPGKHTRDIYDKLHQEYVDITNQLDPLFTGSCQEAYQHRKTEVDNADALMDQYDAERKSIAESIEKSTWVHDDYHFSESDLSELSKLYIDNDYTNDYMLLTDSDDAVSAIDEQLKLLSAAQDDLYIASQPQYIYSTSLDNFLAKYEYKNYTDNLNLGDFLYLGVRDDYVVKLRAISASYNPMKMDNSLQIEFSNMIRSRADRNDFSYMLNSTSGRGKSSSSGNSHGFLGNEGVTLTAGLIQKLLQAGAFSNKVGQIINNEFAGYIGSFISVKNLNAEMIKATDIVGENGFFEYLQSKLISTDKIISDSAEFGKLKAFISYIDTLLSGTISAELGHIIRLTAETVTIDEAVIRDIIAAQITVSMLKTSSISSNKFYIESDDGGLSIVGNTMQFKDVNNITRIQIGRDTKNNFTFCLYDEDGSGILIDSTGIKDSAISDGLIKDDMIANNTISKDKLAFNTVETDENGNVDAAKVIINGKGVDTEFTSIKEDLLESKIEMSGVSTKVDAVEKSITDKIWKDTVLTVKDKDGNDIQKTLESAIVESITDIHGINTSITNVDTTVREKADKTTVQLLEEKVTNIEETADGLSIKVSKKQNATTTAFRYIRDWISDGYYVTEEQVEGVDDDSNTYIQIRKERHDVANEFVELKVLRGEENIAKGVIPVPYDKDGNKLKIEGSANSDEEDLIYGLPNYTDDDIESTITGTNLSMLQIDLGEIIYDADLIKVWHAYPNGEIFNHKLEVSQDGENWIIIYDTLINGGYEESESGRSYLVNDSYVDYMLGKFNLRANSLETIFGELTGTMTSVEQTAEKYKIEVANRLNDISNFLSDESLSSEFANYFETKYQISLGQIIASVAQMEEDMKVTSEIVQSSDGWKALFSILGLGDVINNQTCIKMNVDGMSVSNIRKKDRIYVKNSDYRTLIDTSEIPPYSVSQSVSNLVSFDENSKNGYFQIFKNPENEKQEDVIIYANEDYGLEILYKVNIKKSTVGDGIEFYYALKNKNSTSTLISMNDIYPNDIYDEIFELNDIEIVEDDESTTNLSRFLYFDDTETDVLEDDLIYLNPPYMFANINENYENGYIGTNISYPLLTNFILKPNQITDYKLCCSFTMNDNMDLKDYVNILHITNIQNGYQNGDEITDTFTPIDIKQKTTLERIFVDVKNQYLYKFNFEPSSYTLNTDTIYTIKGRIKCSKKFTTTDNILSNEINCKVGLCNSSNNSLLLSESFIENTANEWLDINVRLRVYENIMYDSFVIQLYGYYGKNLESLEVEFFTLIENDFEQSDGNTTVINPLGIKNYFNDGYMEGYGKEIFSVVGDNIDIYRVRVQNGIDLVTLKELPIIRHNGDTAIKGIAFVPSGGNS